MSINPTPPGEGLHISSPTDEHILRSEAEQTIACVKFANSISDFIEKLGKQEYLDLPHQGRVPMLIDLSPRMQNETVFQDSDSAPEVIDAPRACIQYGNGQTKFTLVLLTPKDEIYRLELFASDRDEDIANPDAVIASIDETFYRTTGNREVVQRTQLSLCSDSTMRDEDGRELSAHEVAFEVDFINTVVKPELVKEKT